ncbi:MAG: hypothetical protein KDA80_00780 [Planctomycetaceae bacterium]|nr:hypothetical protein [Planctomycetaceae bacterium]
MKQVWRFFRLAMALLVIASGRQLLADEPLRVATFSVDASPPIGSPLAYDPTKGIQTPLSCKGIVLLGAEKPIVLCAVDWIGIASGGQTLFKESLAAAAGTSPDRVAVHTLHQHDAPRCDFAAEDVLNGYGLQNVGFDARHARQVVRQASAAIQSALPKARPVTHLGLGRGIIENVASNRRILGDDGKVKVTRYTACRDPEVRALPVGTIDPELNLVSFWDGETPLAVLTYYATHPQSYYRTGLANPDFPGLARNARERETGTIHIHFNGAGGNIGAGKWNDGSHENRQVLADRVAAGMKQAWESIEKQPLSATDLAWETEPVLLPVANHLNEDTLLQTLESPDAKPDDKWYAAKHLVWLRRCQQEDPIPLSCLRIGDCRILHLPGELFVEYQLAAKRMRPDGFVAMAAYGDYAPGYIGTEIAYSQGGYETSERASRVAPGVEQVLLDGIKALLDRTDLAVSD